MFPTGIKLACQTAVELLLSCDGIQYLASSSAQYYAYHATFVVCCCSGTIGTVCFVTTCRAKDGVPIVKVTPEVGPAVSVDIVNIFAGRVSADMNFTWSSFGKHLLCPAMQMLFEDLTAATTWQLTARF
jgi:hypothetical protein